MGHLQCSRNLPKHLVKDRSTHRFGSEILPFQFVGQGVRFRKLEVILTTSIEKLGKAGETVTVAPGYFRNHLMPKLLAVPNIEKYTYLSREQRKLYQHEEVETVTVVPKTEEDKMKEYHAAAKRLDNARLRFINIDDSSMGNPGSAGTAGHFTNTLEVLRRLITAGKDLQTPVTKDELAAEVARQLCVSIQPENLRLLSPLSTLGEYEVPLQLPRSIPLPEGKVHWTLNVKIRSK